MSTLRFSARVQKIEVSAIKQMPLYARSVPDALSLGQGIPSLPTPSYIRRAIQEALENDPAVGKYSLQPGLPALKEAVARLVTRKAHRPVDPEREIFISAGAMEALFAAFVSLVEEGDEVLLFDPSYASHIEQVVFAGGIPVFVPLQEQEGWALDPDQLRRALSPRTKGIVVCHPGNPTGKVFSAEELSQIVTFAHHHDLFVIADETYDFLVHEGVPYQSLATYHDIASSLILCGSFSKQFAMTGWRVGYMYAPSAMIDQALKVHDAAVICAPTISQYAALAALTVPDREHEQEEIRRTLQQRGTFTCAQLEDLSELFSFVPPQGAYYILLKYHGRTESSLELALKLLHEAKVITIPGSAFGPQGEGHLRISFGGTEEEIARALHRIKAWHTKH